MAILIEWLPFLLFAALCAAAMVIEIHWLSGRGWTTGGRATAFVVITDVLALVLSLFVVFVVLGMLLMMVLGPSGRGSGAGNMSYAAVLLFGLVVPAVLLIFLKRLTLAALSIRSGSSAWTYSLTS